MVRPCHFNFYFWYQIDLTYTLQDGMDCLQSCLTDLPTEAIFYLLEGAAAGCLIIWVLLWGIMAAMGPCYIHCCCLRGHRGRRVEWEDVLS